YREDNALFLLDEPETHFNPAWRAQFISRLRECFADKNGEGPSPEILITTHTPFLISDSEPEQVLVFDKQDNVVTVERPDYNTLGASINQITLKTFNKRETIGGYAQQKMNEFKRQFEAEKDSASTEQMQNLINEINQKLGDSVEKVLLVKTILDAMEKAQGVSD
ncbi:MAG: AAA family ATPase, partial [Thiotrichaceae bacterium]